MPLTCPSLRRRSGRRLSALDSGGAAVPEYRRGTVLGAVLVAVVVIATAGGCTDKPVPPPAPASTAQPSTPAPVSGAVKVSLEADGLSAAGRAALAKAIGSVVGDWLEAAYLSGPVGGKPGSHQFPGFTSGASRSAATHPKELTNAALGAKAKGLVPTARLVKASAYVSGHRAQGVVADVTMTAASPLAKLTVHGSVFLTRAGGHWRIFGYHVTTATA